MRDPAWPWVNPNSSTSRGKMGGTDWNEVAKDNEAR